MSKSYINIPMTDAEKAAFEKSDAFWTGPRLVALCAVTLGCALFVLTAAAWGWIGPKQGDTLAPVAHETAHAAAHH